MSNKVGAVIGAITLLGLVIGVRHYVQTTEPHTDEAIVLHPARLITPIRPMAKAHSEAEPSSDSSDESGEQGEAAPALAGIAAAPGSPAPVTTARAGTPPAAAHRQESSGGAATESEADEAAGTPRPPNAPSLSVSFNGSTKGADQTAPLISQDVQFDDATGSAVFPPGAALAYPDSGGIDPEQGTVMFWFSVKDPPGPNGRVLLSLSPGTWENRMIIGIGPSFIRFVFATSDGTETSLGSPISLPPDQWHNVAVTWGQAEATLYTDGAARDQETYSGSFTIPPGTPLNIAPSKAVPPGSDQFPGTVALRSLQIFQQMLGPDDINNLLAQTAPPKQ